MSTPWTRFSQLRDRVELNGQSDDRDRVTARVLTLAHVKRQEKKSTTSHGLQTYKFIFRAVVTAFMGKVVQALESTTSLVLGF